MRFARRLSAALVLAAPLPAQFINRAVWLGVEEEGITSSFRRGVEYYVDRASYVNLAPWWNRGLPYFEDRAYYRFGSVTGREFTVEGGVDHTVDLGRDFAFRFHVLQSETRDTRFLRNSIELEYPFGQEAAVFIGGELFADKSLIDVSAGAWLWRRNAQGLRVMVTAVDAPSKKSRRVEYSTDPWALMLAGAFGDPASHRVTFEIGGQLPFKLRDLSDGSRFELHRWIGSFETHLRLGARDWLVGAAELEWTDKQRSTAALVSDFRRDFGQLRLEWWRDGEMPWSVGVLHTSEYEDQAFSSGALPMRMRREEWMGIGRLRVPIGEPFAFEPQVLAGTVRRHERLTTNDLTERFEGKVALNTRYAFSEHATIAFVVTAELDELGFGGGGVQFVARF